MIRIVNIRYLLATAFFLVALAASAQTNEPVTATELYTITAETMLSNGEFSPQSRYFVIQGRNNSIKMYDSDQRLLWSYAGRGNHGTTQAIAFSPDGEQLIFPGYGDPAVLAVVQSKDGVLLQRLPGHNSDIKAIALSPNGLELASYSEGELRIWRKTGESFSSSERLTLEIGNIAALRYSPDGESLLLAASEQQVIIMPAGGGSLRQIIRPRLATRSTVYIHDAVYSSDGKWLAISARDELFIYSNSGIGQNVDWQLEQHESDLDEGYVYSLAFASDDSVLFTGYGAGTISTWLSPDHPANDSQSPWLKYSTFEGPQEYMSDLSVNSSGDQLASTSISENGVVFWQIQGVGPGAAYLLGSTLREGWQTSSLSPMMRSLLTPDWSASMLTLVADDLLAPRDMFETSAHYEERQARGRRQLLAAALDAVFAAAGADDADGQGAKKISLDGPGTYDIDAEIYQLSILSVEGSISIAPDAARQLYRNWQEADVIWNPSGDWSLMLPGSHERYVLLFDHDPVTGAARTADGYNLATYDINDSLRLENVSVLPIFPALSASYAEIPLVTAVLASRYNDPLTNVRITTRAGGDGEEHTIFSSRVLAAGADVDLHFTLLLPTVEGTTNAPIVPMNISIGYERRGSEYNHEVRIPLEQLNANALTWDDDRKVAAMVSSFQSPLIMQTAGAVAALSADIEAGSIPRAMTRALAIFAFIEDQGVRYRVDPVSPYRELSSDSAAVDFVQYAGETLRYASGDCDDLSVLFASLLEASGIPSAFITTPGHILAAFDPGITPAAMRELFPDSTRYIVRGDRVWVPMEMTVVGEGFESAWNSGMGEWITADSRGEAVLFSTASAWEVYPPAGTAGATDGYVPGNLNVQNFSSAYRKFLTENAARNISAAGLDSPDSQRDFNRRGVAYARLGLYREAESDFRQALSQGEYVPALLNLARISTLEGRKAEAAALMQRARSAEPENARIVVNMAIQAVLSGEIPQAAGYFSQALEMDQALAAQYPELAALLSRATSTSTGDAAGTASGALGSNGNTPAGGSAGVANTNRADDIRASVQGTSWEF